jgi:hypothetical protein
VDSSIYRNVSRFMRLHAGLDIAFGTGQGRWIKRPPTLEDFSAHLSGRGPGIGIAPLRPDNTVKFAAIDLDEPDFDAAREMQKYIPGVSWIESSRSGNAHVWVFFDSPVAAWVPMGILKEATIAAGKDHVEVFPKNHDFAKVKLGNYINLSYYGTSRPILDMSGYPDTHYQLEPFLDAAEQSLNSPRKWEQKADWLMISPPESRARTQEFGSQKTLHICADHIISGDAGPVTEGHRSIVYFCLAKMLTNWEQVDHDETVDIMRSVNEMSAPDSISDSELLRIVGNAERGQFTSTGCDDPLFAPYAHPSCHIAHPR